MVLGCTGNMSGPHFSLHEIFPKPCDFPGHLFVFFFVFLTISFPSFLTVLSENTFRLFLEHLLHGRGGRGCQEFWCGCPLGSVGVLTPTVEYNSPPMQAPPPQQGNAEQPHNKINTYLLYNIQSHSRNIPAGISQLLASAVGQMI